MMKKVNITVDNLLGYGSKLDLYNQLFKNSAFVFPEYNTKARQGISKHTADLLASGVYSGSEFIAFSGSKNNRIFYHLKKLAEKGFVSYANGKRKSKMRFNLDNVKSKWLKIDHQITDEEFETMAIGRIDESIKIIQRKTFDLMGCRGALVLLSDIASNLERLIDDLIYFESNKK